MAAIELEINSMGLIASYNLRSMMVRKGTAAMTAMGIAMVVAVFVMTLAIAQGFNGALVASGSNENAILLRKGATSETVSGVLRSQLPLIEACRRSRAPPTATSLASPELVVIIALPRVSDNQPANVPARGVGPLAFEIRNTMKFVEGRRFTPGTREINVGKQATVRFKGLTLGSDVKFGGSIWKVVGIFTDDDASFESEVWGDVDLMMPAFQRNGYQSVTVKLTDPSAFESFAAALGADPRLDLKPYPERDYYQGQSETTGTLIRVFATFVTADPLDRRGVRRDEHHVRRRRLPHARNRHPARARFLASRASSPRFWPSRSRWRSSAASSAACSRCPCTVCRPAR